MNKNILHTLIVRLIISFLSGIWVIGFFLPALVSDKSIEQSVLPFVKHSYSLVCHQNEEKSFSVNEKKLFVCSRCTGIYSGAFLSSLFLVFTMKQFKLTKIFLWLTPVPMLVDVLLIAFGFYQHNKITSLTTGLFLGSVLFIYISDVLEKLPNKR